MRFRFTSILLFTILIASCDKKPVPDTEDDITKATVNFEIDNRVGNAQLSLNDAWYTTANGDSLNITTYAYYISNIKLITSDGKEYVESESYHLIDESRSATKKFTIADVPDGNYTAITFMIGVDSTRNVSGAQTGDLAVEHGMFWDWDTGYIMAKLEGGFSVSPLKDRLIYHMGGYAGDYSVLRTVTLQLPEQMVVSASSEAATIHMKNDALEWFQTPVKVDISQVTSLGGKDSKIFADNYADMFSIEHID